MLGRYVAGTLLVLGAAMMVAPDAPEPAVKAGVAVARTETSPALLATASPAAMAAAVRTVPEQPVPEQSAPVVAESQAIQSGVELALEQALAMDAAEVGEPPEALAEMAMETSEPVPDASIQEAPELVLAGALEFPVSAELTAPATVRLETVSLAEPEARRLFVTGTRVNVREGPSTQYRVVGTVSHGDVVELVTFEGQSWARIRLPDGKETGYMSRRFLADDLSGG